jgi:glycosyltransferase involved in cell wall biosynthesis
MVSFSVVRPTRNRAAFLRQAIESVLAQTHSAQEIIVVDDGTGAAAALKDASPLIRVLDNRERGPVPARNLGVAQAQGDVIAFLDDDDWWADRDYLAEAAKAFANGAALCFGDGIMAFEDGREQASFAFDADATSLERDNTILISAVTYRRSLHGTLGPFDEALPSYWDWDWYLRVARAGWPLVHLARPLVAICVHARNMSGDALERQRRENLDRFSAKHGLPPVILKNHLNLVTDRPPERR